VGGRRFGRALWDAEHAAHSDQPPHLACLGLVPALGAELARLGATNLAFTFRQQLSGHERFRASRSPPLVMFNPCAVSRGEDGCVDRARSTPRLTSTVGKVLERCAQRPRRHSAHWENSGAHRIVLTRPLTRCSCSFRHDLAPIFLAVSIQLVAGVGIGELDLTRYRLFPAPLASIFCEPSEGEISTDGGEQPP
jgi:hypothetical protein